MTGERREAIIGCLLGTALGDALGLPYEGLSPRRAERLWGAPDRFRFLADRGMVSDDTEHTCMVAQSLIVARGDPERFGRELARRLRWWLLALPAGIGWATLRAILRLWVGFPPARSGVSSAGNGPAMRAAILGAFLEEPGELAAFVGGSTRITHTDPRAEAGALAIALAAQMAVRQPLVPPRQYAAALEALLAGGAMPADSSTRLIDLVHLAVRSVRCGESTYRFAQSLGLQSGVSGYVYHSVPVALHAWMSFPRDFIAAVTAVVRCGGDADTTAAMVGGIVGAAVGETALPAPLLEKLAEWPRSVAWIRQLGAQLDASRYSPSPLPAPRLSPAAVVLRNLLFLAVVLLHGLRRLAPPY